MFEGKQPFSSCIGRIMHDASDMPSLEYDNRGEYFFLSFLESSIIHAQLLDFGGSRGVLSRTHQPRFSLLGKEASCMQHLQRRRIMRFRGEKDKNLDQGLIIIKGWTMPLERGRYRGSPAILQYQWISFDCKEDRREEEKDEGVIMMMIIREGNHYQRVVLNQTGCDVNGHCLAGRV